MWKEHTMIDRTIAKDRKRKGTIFCTESIARERNLYREHIEKSESSFGGFPVSNLFGV
jgi:hypothetical protein